MTMADTAATAEQVAAGPVAGQLTDDLLIDVRAENGSIVDATGQHDLSMTAGIGVVTLTADAGVTPVAAGSTVDLDVGVQLAGPGDSVTHLDVSGFLAGTEVSDGVNSIVVTDAAQKVDMTGWQLDTVTAKLPIGGDADMALTVEATVTTAPYATGALDANNQPIMTTDSVVVTDHQTILVEPTADPVIVSIGAKTSLEVIDTGTFENPGRIVEERVASGQVNEFTLEMMVFADPAAGAAHHDSVLVNIGSSTDSNVLTLWDPVSLTVSLGDRDIMTGVDLTDGAVHRITLTWDEGSGEFKIYDNGSLVETTSMSEPPNNLYMAIAQKANDPPRTGNSGGGDYHTEEHFEGDIYYVTMSDQAATAEQVAAGPASEQLASRLLIDVRAENGQVVDTTGTHNIQVNGGISVQEAVTDAGQSPVPAGSTLDLDIGLQLADADDTISHLAISGFIAGSEISDGVNTIVALDPGQKIDLTGWQLDSMTAKLPGGVRSNMDLTVEATVTTQPYPTGGVDANNQPIMTTDSMVVTEHQTILVEYAPVDPMPIAPAAPAAAMMAMFSAPSGDSTDSSSATDPYLALASEPQPESGPSDPAASDSPTDPYRALAQAAGETADPTASTGSDSPTAGYMELVTGSGTPPQEPPPPDQLFADQQIAGGDSLYGAGEPEALAAVEEAAAAAVATLPPEDPLAAHYE